MVSFAPFWRLGINEIKRSAATCWLQPGSGGRGALQVCSANQESPAQQLQETPSDQTGLLFGGRLGGGDSSGKGGSGQGSWSCYLIHKAPGPRGGFHMKGEEEMWLFNVYFIGSEGEVGAKGCI